MKKSVKILLLAILSTVFAFSAIACGHVHTYEDSWSSDANKHWKQATCEHDEKIEEADHTFGAGVLNSAKTEVTYTCSVCGYAKKETHTHTYGAWETVTPATIFADGEKSRVCTLAICGEEETETIEKIAVQSISVTTNPTKMTYGLGETFDKTGMVVKALGADNEEYDVTSLITVSQTAFDTIGSANVTVTYGTFTDTLTVSVVHVCNYDGVDWVVETPATIFNSGLKYKTCTISGCQEDRLEEVIPQVEVVSISVATAPSKLSYQIGETFDKTGMVVKALGEDNNEYDVTSLITVEDNELTLINNKLTVSYLTYTTEVTVEVTHTCEYGDWVVETPATIFETGLKYKTCTVEGCEEDRFEEVIPQVEVQSIALTTPATKVTYALGETFDKTGMVVTATGVDESTADITSLCTIEEDALTLLNNKVTVTYLTFSFEIEVEVTHDCVFETWEVETPATILTTGVKYSICSVDGCNERKEATIPYVEVKSISVTTNPTKMTYALGETFDKTGMVVTATGVDDSTADVSEIVTVSKTPLTLTNNKVVILYGTALTELTVEVTHTCEYGDWIVETPATIFNSGLKYKTCTVEGCEEDRLEEVIPQVEVVSISVVTAPNKLSYQIGETFDKTGMVVKALGEDNVQYDVTSYITVDETAFDIIGANNVTVTYEGFTTQIEITVTHVHDFDSAEWVVETPATILEKGVKYRVCTVNGCEEKEYGEIETVEVEKIEITTQPNKINYVTGETFDKTGMVVTATGVDGSTADVSALVTVTDDTFETVGEVTITVTYGSVETTLSVNVELSVISVSKALQANVGEVVKVRGYYVGVANLDQTSRSSENVYTDTHILIKDTETDDIIGVRKEFATFVSGTADWTYTKQYTYGDLVEIIGTVTADSDANNQNYIEYSNENPANSETIISSGNTVCYDFENAIHLTEQSKFEETFTTSLKPMTLIRITGEVLGVRCAPEMAVKGTRNATRQNALSLNVGATTWPKVNKKYVALIDNVLTANLGSTSWNKKIPYANVAISANWGSAKKTTKVIDIYVMYVGYNAYNFELVMLDSSWLTVCEHDYTGSEGELTQDGTKIAFTCNKCGYVHLSHVHVYDGADWVIETPSTVIEHGVKYRVCTYDGCEEREYAEAELATPVSIEVTQMPNLWCSPGQKVTDLTGITVIATGDNGTTADVSAYVTAEDKEVSYDDNSVKVYFGDLYVTIYVNMIEEHTHDFDGAEWLVERDATIFEAGVKYQVCNYPYCQQRNEAVIDIVETISIEVSVEPTKTNYKAFEVFNPAGMTVIANGADGKEYPLSLDDITYTQTPLSLGENEIVISYNGFTTSLFYTATAYDVSELSSVEEGTQLAVVGYYAGVAEEGKGADKELLIKDLNTDDIIAIRNVSYGDIDNGFGYQKGDKIQIITTLGVETDEQTLGKRYLAFSQSNSASVSDTIIASGCDVNYSFENAIDVFANGAFSNSFIKDGNFYKIMKLKGCVYAFKNAVSDDSEFVLTIHINTEFSNNKIAQFKSGGKYVSLRDNVMQVNVGESWLEYFGGDFIYEITSSKCDGPGYASFIDFYAVYTGGDATNYQLTILDANWMTSTDTVFDGEYTNAEVLQEVAFAYFRQLGQIQYNQTVQRRNINISPEDSTEQHQAYVDCSSFANAIFYNAFGMNIIADGSTIVKDGVTTTNPAPQTYNTQLYAEQYYGQDVAILGTWKPGKTDNEGNAYSKQAFYNEITQNIQPGDVINYRYGDGSSSRGHIIVYMGNDTFMHSRGGDMMVVGGVENEGKTDEFTITSPSQTRDVAWTYEQCSTVSFMNKWRVFDEPDGDRNIFTKGVISWIRPLARENVTPTANSLARMQYQGLETEKTADVGLYTSVHKGQEITYTITATNHSKNNYSNIVVKEVLDDDVTLVTAPQGYSEENGVLTFSFDINKLSSKQFTYTVKVNEDAESGTAIESMQTTVGGILTSMAYNLVSGYTETELASVVNKANGYVTNATTFDNPMDLVKDLYADLGVTAFDNYTTVGSLFDDLMDITNDVLNDCDIKGMVAPNLYGGRNLSNAFIRDNKLVRLIEETNLSLGDIILADYRTSSQDTEGNTVFTDVNYVIYVYVGNGKFVTLTNDETITDSTTCITRTMSGTQFSKCGTHILVTLYNYSRYAVIRPSIVA